MVVLFLVIVLLLLGDIMCMYMVGLSEVSEVLLLELMLM